MDIDKYIKVSKNQFEEFSRMIITTTSAFYHPRELNGTKFSFLISTIMDIPCGYIQTISPEEKEYYALASLKNMKKHDFYLKYYIKIGAVEAMRIRNLPEMPIKSIRKGNRFFSSREDKIFNRLMNKRQWRVIMYSYSKVPDPRYFHGRELEVSEIYLNPEFKHLLYE